MDVGIYSVYRLYKHTFFELMTGWLEAAPGRTVELRMFAQGLIMTDEPANIKAIMSTEVRLSIHGCERSMGMSDNHDSITVSPRAT